MNRHGVPWVLIPPTVGKGKVPPHGSQPGRLARETPGENQPKDYIAADYRQPEENPGHRTTLRYCLRGQDYQFRKHLEVVDIESVNAVDAVGLHGGDDLQIEHVSAGDGVSPQQLHPPANRRAGIGNTCRPGSASRAERMPNASAGAVTRATCRGLVMTAYSSHRICDVT